MNERTNGKTVTCTSGAGSDGNQFELFRLRADAEFVALEKAFFIAPVSQLHAQQVAPLRRQQMKVLVA